MNLPNLDKLVEAKTLKKEPFDAKEFTGMLNSGRVRLNDANNTNLAAESRFDLAYNAAHSLALAALRLHGYRADNKRYVVFQVLPFTAGLANDAWRILDKCHNLRNISEYEGDLQIDDQILNDLLLATQKLLECVEQLGNN